MKEPNENRPGYKETKVGWIPKEWECRHLRDLFKVSKQCGTAGLPVFSVTMDRGMVPRDSLDRKMAPDVPPERSLLVEPNDLAYNMMRMWQGAVAVCRTKGVISPAYVVCRPIADHADSNFMLLFFKSHVGLYKLWSYSYGITSDRLRLYFQDFCLVPAPVPPLPEQQKIAEILSTWDAAIEQKRKLIDAKKRRKKGLMQQLLTPPAAGQAGRKRLPGFSDDWTAHKLGTVFKERCETGREDLPLLAITGGRGVIPAEEIERKDSSSADKARYKRIAVGDIGYNTMRMWQGVNALSSLEGIVSPAYTICTPSEALCGTFLSYYFKFQPVVHWFYRYSQGLVSDTWNLKFHHFAQISLPFPERDEQEAIGAVLKAADEEIACHEQELAALEKQKRGLMQKLLMGTVRVKV